MTCLLDPSANIWLHLATSLLGFYFGLAAPRTSAVDRTVEQVIIVSHLVWGALLSRFSGNCRGGMGIVEFVARYARHKLHIYPLTTAIPNEALSLIETKVMRGVK